MTDLLLEAAKAVLDARVFTGPHRERLRAAVERAERQKEKEEWTQPIHSDFIRWYSDTWYMKAPFPRITVAEEAWIAAQQAERERIKNIISTHVAAEVSELLEKIDERVN